MAAEWPQRSFAELISTEALEIGDGYRAKNSELGGDGPIFLRAGHVRDTHIDLRVVERFHRHLANAVASKMCRPGDVIVTTKGNSTGRTGYVSEDLPPFVYSPHLSYWRSLNLSAIDPGYLRYWSQSQAFQHQLSGLSASTDMAPYLSLIDQKRLQIILPPISAQGAIARILGALDDKIELNRRMNETLETMARARFAEWFSEQGLSGVRKVIATLIDDRVITIGDGYRAKNDELGFSGLPFIRAGELNNGFDVEAADKLLNASVAISQGRYHASAT
jgi:type I restriction enzyme S subunit